MPSLQHMKKLFSFDYTPQIVFLLMACNFRYVAATFCVYNFSSKLYSNYALYQLFVTTQTKKIDIDDENETIDRPFIRSLILENYKFFAAIPKIDRYLLYSYAQKIIVLVYSVLVYAKKSFYTSINKYK